MESKIEYAVITTKEYKELIEDNINKERCIKELNCVNKEEKELFKKLENYFFQKLVENENYHLENMKECNVTDYHYHELYKCFLDIVIDNLTYIHFSISSLKHNFDNRKNEETEG